MTGHTPVVVGVGDFVNRSKKVEDAIEPLELILRAIRAAVDDTGLSGPEASKLQAQIDSLDIVKTWTWPYPDLCSLVAKRLEIKPTRRHYSEHGGNQPGKLFDEAARRIALGETKVAVLSGGEALASLTACAAAKQLPPPGWTKLSEDVNSVFSPSTRELLPSGLPGKWTPPTSDSDLPGLGARHGIGNPIQVYPLYENSFRARRRQSIADNHRESAQMYAEFASVAEQNQYAWSYWSPAETEESIGTVSKKNRMICLPYPLLMNAFNTINLAGACILTSAENARELGIPSNRWIYPLGGAGTRDSDDFWERSEYWWSPAISRSIDAGLEASGLDKEDVDLFDFYSCFPIVPKLACEHLGIPSVKGAKPITLLGGLTSFGGAGNNYSMHAITEMVRQLREGKGKNGLVLANGGVVTYQAAICLSSSPRRDGLPYPSANPLPAAVKDVQTPQVDEKAEGDAIIETYTVEFNRDGSPLRGFIVGRLKSNGHRFLGNHADDATLQQLCSQKVEPIGRDGKVKTADDGRNLFVFVSDSAKL
ncbi:uncharacterized protein LTR77_000284 [Saxophila tyrrhenica]|uniref:Thiolase-like protein type 1 additional C-terminal domain-containing protein n=1 Tax=Saxophila tyrrhenica TaxID=1690608 RepID=A0AAV9PQD9_9PEZI|nr:hypothetical protein LTR77_000284 [Saxophila tyrrhenica]